ALPRSTAPPVPWPFDVPPPSLRALALRRARARPRALARARASGHSGSEPASPRLVQRQSPFRVRRAWEVPLTAGFRSTRQRIEAVRKLRRAENDQSAYLTHGTFDHDVLPGFRTASLSALEPFGNLPHVMIGPASGQFVQHGGPGRGPSRAACPRVAGRPGPA